MFAGKALDGVYDLLFAGIRYNAPQPSLDMRERVFTVDVPSGTVRDVLNALVVAHGQLTWYARSAHGQDRNGTRVTVALRDFSHREISASWRGTLKP